MRHHRLALAGSLTSLALTAASVTGAGVPATAAVTPAAAAASAPWMDTSLSASHRADLLVAAMTLGREAGHGARGRAAAGRRGRRLGSRPTSASGSRRWPSATGRWASGNGATGVTQWPDATNQASTWDPRAGPASGARRWAREFGGKGRNVALTPTVNILRVPVVGPRV